MFLCARDTSVRRLQALDNAESSSHSICISSFISQRPDPSLCNAVAPQTLPFCRSQDSADSAAYLQRLSTLTRLVAYLLDVHTLSPSLQFSAGESVAVDAAEWWKEVQKQSIRLVQRQETATAHKSDKKRKLRPTRSLWPLTTRSLMEQESKPFDRVLTTSETFEDLSEDIRKDSATDFFAQALYLIIRTLERVNERRLQSCEGQEVIEVDVLISVDKGVAVVAAELLQSWALVSQEMIVDSMDKASKLMGVVVVNVLLQACKVGMRHTFHDHLLLPSLPLRASAGAKQWTCSVCQRVTPTTGLVADRVGCMYRCAACNFNLCRECFTRIPNVTGPRLTSSLADTTKLTTDRFLALVVPQLRHKTGAVVVLQIAQELRRRVLELYPHNFLGAAEFAQLFHNLLMSDKSAAIALALPPPASIPSSGRPAVAWFPLFMQTWTMSLSTLLGPFLRASTMLEGTHDFDAAVRAVNGSAGTEGLRAQWTNGYAKLRNTLQSLMRTLLADDQHPLVVDATLCWLALTLMTADPRRRLNYDAHERLDGFLVNITTMLLAHTLPVLEKVRHDPSCIDGSYHQSFEPVRVYASKDFPEVPLHYSRSTQDAGGNKNASDAEICEITARDETCTSEYRAQIPRLERDDEKTPSTYYPRLSCHEGVVCDQCEFSHLDGVRYKCAFCGDMDLCSDCFEVFCSHQAATHSSSESDPIHRLDHVFLRVESPIPVFALKHFQPLPAEWLTSSRQRCASSNVIEYISAGFDVPSMQCADCGDVLGATGKPDDVFYKCANCFSTRVVCAACLTREEKSSNGNPNDLHAPGHVYFVVTDPWRRRLSIPWNNVLGKLHFRRLLHPPALIPRLRFPRDTELFYMTLKYLHFGPLTTLSRWLSMMKEVQELQAFCVCDEERFELERRRQNGSQRQPLKQSIHYKASKSRLADIRVKCVKVEIHLLASANVADWLVFYARTCRWLLHAASTTDLDLEPGTAFQDPYSEPLSHFSSMFSGFPEHFFFDLCDVVYLLGLEKLKYCDLVAELTNAKHDSAEAIDEVEEVVEPLLVMLTQMVIASKFTKNPHLRVEALRSLTTLVTFVSKGQDMHHRRGHQRMDLLFKRHRLLSRWLIPGLLQFHSDMDRYNASNNGLAFTSAATSGDHILWGFLPTRISVTMLLRYLWQLPSQRQCLLHVLSTPNARQTSLSMELINTSTQQLTEVVSGLWSDITKLFDEATNKITTLRQIHELIEDSLDGNVVVLPFRRDMLDGYVAINAKQLRLTLRLLLEALELTSWFASIVSGETKSCSRSLSASAAALRYVLLQPLVVEQAARMLSFLLASLANVHEEKEWTFSLSLVDDGKLLLAHLVVLVVRYAGHSAQKSLESSASSNVCSPSSFWTIVQSSGDIMKRRVGDLDTHVRWGLNALCTRIESENYLGSLNLDDDDKLGQMQAVMAKAHDELDEDEALALLEKQTVSGLSSVRDTSRARKRLGKRFIATLAKDGRFDLKLFVDGCRFLRLEQTQTNDLDDKLGEKAQDVKEEYLYLDSSWAQQFVRVLQEAGEMIHVQKAMEACLGDIPDQYLDPLLSTLMTDPVRLPSGNIVDRAVIARHLLASSQQGGSTSSDPFTREPLTMAMVEPCDTLRCEIQMYLRSKMRHFHKTAREDVLATWGLGWNVLFDSSSETEGDSEDGIDGGNTASKASASR